MPRVNAGMNFYVPVDNWKTDDIKEAIKWAKEAIKTIDKADGWEIRNHKGWTVQAWDNQKGRIL